MITRKRSDPCVALELDPEKRGGLPAFGAGLRFARALSGGRARVSQRDSIRPACWSCYNELGIFLENQNRFGEAAQAFQKVIELAPDNPWGYTNFGNAYLYLGEFARAEDTYRRGLSFTPRIPTLPPTPQWRRSTWDAIRRTCTTPNWPLGCGPGVAYWANLADAYRLMPEESGQAASAYRKAIELAEKQLKVNPNDAETLGRLVLFYARTANPRKRSTIWPPRLRLPTTIGTLSTLPVVHLERASAASDEMAGTGGSGRLSTRHARCRPRAGRSAA